MFSKRTISSQQHALQLWREAADVVAERWATFLQAEAEGRPWAFASYVAALDAEELAAADLAALVRAQDTALPGYELSAA